MRQIKTNWLRLEDRIRGVLKTANSYVDDCPTANAGDLALLLHEISEIIGQETGRGYEIEKDLFSRFEKKGETV